MNLGNQKVRASKQKKFIGEVEEKEREEGPVIEFASKLSMNYPHKKYGSIFVYLYPEKSENLTLSAISSSTTDTFQGEWLYVVSQNLKEQ